MPVFYFHGAYGSSRFKVKLGQETNHSVILHGRITVACECILFANIQTLGILNIKFIQADYENLQFNRLYVYRQNAMYYVRA